jgi:hypothetical protein
MDFRAALGPNEKLCLQENIETSMQSEEYISPSRRCRAMTMHEDTEPIVLGFTK